MFSDLKVSSDRSWNGVFGIDSQSFARLVTLCEARHLELKGRSYEDQLDLSAKGHLARIKTLENLIGYTLMVLKGGLTFDLAAFILQFDQSRAHRQFEKGLAFIHDVLEIEGYTPVRSISSPEEFSAVFSDIDTIIIDGTEQRIQRPHDQDEQKMFYSGKKKAHTYKSMIISTLDKYIHYVSYVYVGTSAEISIMEEEFDPELNWFEGIKVRVDLGYVGFSKKYPQAELYLPHKKPRGGELTEAQKLENKLLAKQRIKVEHSIGGMERYDILSISNRIHKVDSYNLILATCAGLWNFFITR